MYSVKVYLCILSQYCARKAGKCYTLISFLVLHANFLFSYHAPKLIRQVSMAKSTVIFFCGFFFCLLFPLSVFLNSCHVASWIPLGSFKFCCCRCYCYCSNVFLLSFFLLLSTFLWTLFPATFHCLISTRKNGGRQRKEYFVSAYNLNPFQTNQQLSCS